MSFRIVNEWTDIQIKGSMEIWTDLSRNADVIKRNKMATYISFPTCCCCLIVAIVVVVVVVVVNVDVVVVNVDVVVVGVGVVGVVVYW